MKKLNGNWYITKMNDMLGWIMPDNALGLYDNDTGFVEVTMKNKSSGEERKVFVRPHMLPVSSIEYIRPPGE